MILKKVTLALKTYLNGIYSKSTSFEYVYS